MADITYRTGTPSMTVDARTHLSRWGVWWAQVTDGAREGLQISERYHALSRLSTPDLARRGLTRRTIARAALTGH
ncbi:MAG TPA: hypothetical protein VFI98_07305 [Pseudolabrys sp.]|jgi:hypothetical protein|nr:hypothetical protein [Pseudolabrys sp.]